MNELQNLKINFERIPYFKDAFILDDNMESIIENTDIYKNGHIYLQSLSSMLPAMIMQPKANENILDMCAAPGSKTTQMCAISNNQAFITACERNPIRAERLKYNLQAQGCRGTTVIIKDARNLDNFLKFDKILLDAPCSGSGTIDLKDENTFKHFTEELINKSIKTQTILLKKALNLLKAGGELVYSTCSILKEENKDILNKVLDFKIFEIVPIHLDKEIPLLPVKIEGTVCIMPTKLYEGFFIAKIRKKS